MSDDWGVALVGAGYISRIHAEAWGRVEGARVVAVVSRSEESARRLAADCHAERAGSYEDLDALLADHDVRIVCVNSPNYLHADHALRSLAAGKHVIIEKPLCLSLEDADELVAASMGEGCGLAYAENLCFAPRYRAARLLIESGRIGEVRSARQCEKHGGPYSPWFFSLEEAGGGALMDMGCHGIECLRWLVGKPKLRSVSALLSLSRHADRTCLEDEAEVTLQTASGIELISESSWALPGGMQSTLQVEGSEGVLELDLHGRSVLRTLGSDREEVLAAAGEDPLLEEGYPDELAHFLDCFRRGQTPEESGEDGRAVLEILHAAYTSAAGQTPVPLPLARSGTTHPANAWLESRR